MWSLIVDVVMVVGDCWMYEVCYLEVDDVVMVLVSGFVVVVCCFGGLLC